MSAIAKGKLAWSTTLVNQKNASFGLSISSTADLERNVPSSKHTHWATRSADPKALADVTYLSVAAALRRTITSFDPKDVPP